MLLLRWACARGATWKHLKLLSSKRGPQTKLPLSNEGGNECVSILFYSIDSFWCRGDHWELVSERQRDGGRRELKRAPLGDGKETWCCTHCERLQHWERERWIQAHIRLPQKPFALRRQPLNEQTLSCTAWLQTISPFFFLVIGVNEVPPWCTTKASDGRAGPHLG